MYFGYAWPTFLVLSALTGFVLVRVARLARGRGARRRAGARRQRFLVSGRLVSAGRAEAPARGTTSSGRRTSSRRRCRSCTSTRGACRCRCSSRCCTAIVRGLQTRARGWIVLSAFLLAILFEFRPFAYVVLMAALGARRGLFRPRPPRAPAFRGDRGARRRLHDPVSVSRPSRFAPEDRRTRLVIEFFPLVKRMLIKTRARPTPSRTRRRRSCRGRRSARPSSCCWPRSCSSRSASASGGWGPPVCGARSAAGPSARRAADAAAWSLLGLERRRRRRDSVRAGDRPVRRHAEFLCDRPLRDVDLRGARRSSPSARKHPRMGDRRVAGGDRPHAAVLDCTISSAGGPTASGRRGSTSAPLRSGSRSISATRPIPKPPWFCTAGRCRRR